MTEPPGVPVIVTELLPVSLFPLLSLVIVLALAVSALPAVFASVVAGAPKLGTPPRAAPRGLVESKLKSGAPTDLV